MAKDPAFLFYTGDFTTGTQFLTDEQVGKYMRLLMAQHQHGRLSEKQVIFICKSFDSDIMCKFKKDDDGFFYNERLETEISKRKSFSESRSNNKKGKTKDLLNTSKSHDNHMEDENENKDEIKKEVKKENKKQKEEHSDFEILEQFPFEEFWNSYDKKKGPEDCKKKFAKLTEKEKEQIWKHVPEYVRSTPDKQFRLNPLTYINGKHWNDEIIFKNGTNGTNQQSTGEADLERAMAQQAKRKAQREADLQGDGR